MPRDRWREIEELFEQALELPPEKRQAFLDSTAGQSRPPIS